MSTIYLKVFNQTLYSHNGGLSRCRVHHYLERFSENCWHCEKCAIIWNETCKRLTDQGIKEFIPKHILKETHI